jgi:hypothetical protein
MTCCGGRPPEVARRAARVTLRDRNTAVRRGVEVVYLGSTPKSHSATVSGLVYHVAPGARFVRVDRRDLPELLASGEFTLV